MSILIFRPVPTGNNLVNLLRNKGYEAYHCPLIKIISGLGLSSLIEKLNCLRPNDLIIALSKNAIHYAHHKLLSSGKIWPKYLQYYAIGKSTATLWSSMTGSTVKYPMQLENSESLLQLIPLQGINKKRILLLKGNGGRKLLFDVLRKHQAKIDCCQCYQRIPIVFNELNKTFFLKEHKILTLVVTSGGMLEQLHELISKNDHLQWFLQCNLVVVSQRLAELANAIGWYNITVARGADNESLLCALISLIEGKVE